VRLANDGARVDEVLLEYRSHALGAVAAVANEAYSASGQSLNGRDSDLLSETCGDYLALFEAEIKGPAHGFAFRLAAARASRALE
jgi:hypothetical protein